MSTPTEDDALLGVDDSTFYASAYTPDDVNEFRSAAYAAEFDSFLNSDSPDMFEHDAALADIDSLCGCRNDDSEMHMGEAPLFEPGFHVQRIENPEELRKLLESMREDMSPLAEESPEALDFDIDEFFKGHEVQEEQSWLEFADDLRNGRFGELPEDYDGLADDDDEDEEEEEEDEGADNDKEDND